MSNVNVIEKDNVEYMYEDTKARDMLGVMQDDTLVAVQAYSVGNLFWYNNKLYRVIQPVASGATMVIDTDCVETDLETEREKAKNDGVGISSDLLKDTVGWVGKNEFNYELGKAENNTAWSYTDKGKYIRVYTTSNATYRRAAWNNLIVTSNKDYKISCYANITSGSAFVEVKTVDGTMIKSSSAITASGNIDLDFNTGANSAIQIVLYCTAGTSEAGDVTYTDFMLYKASITDGTFEPYHKSVDYLKVNRDEMKETIGWSGKNEFKPTNLDTSVSGVNAVYSDGVYTVTGQSNTNYAPTLGIFTFKAGVKYILSGTPEGYGNNSGMFVRAANANYTIQKIAEPSGVEILFDTDTTLNIEYRIKANTPVSNLQFKPMIRKANIADDTFEPYHESVEVTYEEELHGINLFKPYKIDTVGSGDVTFSESSDGTITATGTVAAPGGEGYVCEFNLPAGTYKLNGLISGGSANHFIDVYENKWTNRNPIYSDGDEVTFTFTTDTNHVFRIFCVTVGTTVNMVVKPMIRKVEIEDPVFRQFNEQSIQNQLNDQTNILGAKNRWPLKLSRIKALNPTGTWSGNSYTSGGVTYNITTENDYVTSVRLSGSTSSDYSSLTLAKGDELAALITKNMILNGCPANDNIYYIGVPNSPSGFLRETGNGIKLVPGSYGTSEQTGALIQVYPNKSIPSENFVFRLMLRLASDPDGTYQLPAMTNRELTEVKEATLTYASGDNQDSYLKKVGRVVDLWIRLNNVTISADGVLTTLPVGYRPTADITVVICNTTDNSLSRGWINSQNGELTIVNALSSKSIRLQACYIV